MATRLAMRMVAPMVPDKLRPCKEKPTGRRRVRFVHGAFGAKTVVEDEFIVEWGFNPVSDPVRTEWVWRKIPTREAYGQAFYAGLASSYTSDRVFDGTRPIPPEQVAKLKENHAKHWSPMG